MKKVFFSYVMICSLLLAAICGCSKDVSLQQGQDLEFPGEPEIETEKPQKPDIDQDEADNDDPDSQDEQEPIEPDLPEVEAAKFVGFNLFSKKEIHFYFLEAFNDVSCTFTPYREIDCIQDGKTVKVLLKENLELQTKFVIEFNVKDVWENSLSIKVPMFINDWIPKMEINELCTEDLNPRAEFIEFKVKSAGNLDGLQLYIMWDAKSPYVFDFPAVDVKSGEYVTLHLRTRGSACVNELGEDLSESAGTDSCPTARDLWVPGSSKLLHKTDIVYLQDANGGILDAVVLNEAPGKTWDKNLAHFAEITEYLYNKGMWKSADGQLPGPLDAVNTLKTSATRSINRYEEKENTHTANDWYIPDLLGSSSPGQPNK
jgi:hypothetical protein